MTLDVAPLAHPLRSLRLNPFFNRKEQKEDGQVETVHSICSHDIWDIIDAHVPESRPESRR